MKLALALVFALVGCASHAAAPAAPAACPDVAEGTLEMRSYFLVLLHRGPAWTPEQTPETTKIFEGHMANIRAMAKSGALVLAGPTGNADGTDSDDPHALAGIFVFGVATQAEVEALIAHDPAIAAGRLVPEILSWYGPVGLTYPGQRNIVLPH